MEIETADSMEYATRKFPLNIEIMMHVIRLKKMNYDLKIIASNTIKDSKVYESSKSLPFI
jgi:hypothetical protein